MAAFSAVVAWMGCSTTKRLKPGDVLLKKVIVKCENPDISKDDIYGYVKQKPNRKLFGLNYPHLLKRGTIGRDNILTSGSGYPFYLHIHNLVSPVREVRRMLRRDARFLGKYSRWDANPRTKRGREKKAPKKHKTIGEFLWGIGEAPVVIDSAKTNRSVNQVASYMDNKGYFHSDVKDTLIYPWLQRNRKRKAILCYIVVPAQPYTIRSITWDIQDPNVGYDLIPDTGAADVLLKPGDNFDVDVFEQERDRLTRALRNRGYYKFSKDYIRFSADTNLGTHQVDVKIIVSRQQFQTSDSTWVEKDHQRYGIRNIYVKCLYDPSQLREKNDTSRYDTTYYREIAFLRNMDSVRGIPIEKVLKYKPEVLASRITFSPLFRQNDYEVTYRQLTSLRVFRQVVIDPVEVGADSLDMFIRLFPFPRQSYTTQLEGTTNSGSSLGIGGSYSYQNNNLFHGAEVFTAAVKGGVEIQKTIGGESVTTSDLGFNTIQAGAETSLNIPREFFPFHWLLRENTAEELRRAQERRTVFTASFNYQSRTDYDRSLGNLSYGYTFRFGTKPRKKDDKAPDQMNFYDRFGIYPVEFNVVKVNPKAGLEDLLANGDPLLRYRFTDHLINDMRVTWVRNTQTPDSRKRLVFYSRVDLECSGIIPYMLFKASNAVPDDQGSYRVGGIPFSHYVRFFTDVRWHLAVGDHEAVVVRLAHGIGFPLANFPTLPLEKSFFGGGANSIRAWEARSLGPGSYIVPADQKYSQFGDVQVEYNVELRFRITRSLNGAVFADGGNIWLLHKDSLREGANFVLKDFKFLQDFAFGPGVGLRYDLSFFIIRLDWAFKVRDPARPYGERWWYGQRQLGSNLNFGIGYPF